MANLKISELTQLSSADNADLFAIVDTSVTETKYITYANLVSGLPYNLDGGFPDDVPVTAQSIDGGTP